MNQSNKTKSSDRLTFFVTKIKREVFFIKNGRIFPFDDLSIDDALMLRSHMENDGNIIDFLISHGITKPTEQLREWIIGSFPDILKHPDFIDGKRITYDKRGRRYQLLNDSTL